ncbi:MAG: hypothetical protein H7Y86_11985 [Rhizobacter sp.]|nr:hypothetical protein [Ferruginibacter sp.]
MKKYKIIDFWISVLLIIGSFIFSLVQFDRSFLIAYYIVGGWQIVSMSIHVFNRWFTHRGDRRYTYHILVGIIVAFSLIGLTYDPVLMFVLFPLVVAAPLMAIYYTWLCYAEIYVKMQRPLALLK